MSQHVDAIFENGVFRPEAPVHFIDGQRVSLEIEPQAAAPDDMSDVADMLDAEFLRSCRQLLETAPSLAEVRKMLGGFTGSLAERIAQERDDR